ncbi:PilZ domain-containing protein [Leptolyngbya sp. 7M]|uniref:PilZ domain-containing protein n=1 Tax=Leptolyngbya sp. 7M TaxID=2812896 RepID=UPI001B8C9F97|nr:PilZ domain-containing protein [Leptolyngbya sp. 7M]QYO65735.1 PilZ domain-containing protein [Leptolyngbya sp. 7M]
MSTIVSEKENRRIQRYELSLPARVEVKVDNKVSWNEVTRLEDISAFGAGFNLKRPVKRGRLILISLPMPRQLRCYDYLEPQYRIWGLVRRCIQVGSNPAASEYAIGVAFIGKNPPSSFLDNPAQLYDLSDREDGGLWQLAEAVTVQDESDIPAYLRRHTRFSIPESLVLELLDENGDVAASEISVTENISLGGACVFTSFMVEPGSFLRVKSERHDLSIIAIVRGRHAGPDGIVRLHLEFIDHYFPLEGIV